MQEGDGHWDSLGVNLIMAGLDNINSLFRAKQFYDSSSSLVAMEIATWPYLLLAAELAEVSCVWWPVCGGGSSAPRCGTSPGWERLPIPCPEPVLGRGCLPWRRCRCRRGPRTGTSGHRAGT